MFPRAYVRMKWERRLAAYSWLPLQAERSAWRRFLPNSSSSTIGKRSARPTILIRSLRCIGLRACSVGLQSSVLSPLTSDP
jgi:hypothetical protein